MTKLEQLKLEMELAKKIASIFEAVPNAQPWVVEFEAWSWVVEPLSIQEGFSLFSEGAPLVIEKTDPVLVVSLSPNGGFKS